jgi:hypothetical protein
MTTLYKSLLHTDQSSQSRCLVTVSSGRRSSVSGLMSFQACSNLTPTSDCWLQPVLPSAFSSRAELTNCRLETKGRHSLSLHMSEWSGVTPNSRSELGNRHLFGLVRWVCQISGRVQNPADCSQHATVPSHNKWGNSTWSGSKPPRKPASQLGNRRPSSVSQSEDTIGYTTCFEVCQGATLFWRSLKNITMPMAGYE